MYDRKSPCICTPVAQLSMRRIIARTKMPFSHPLFPHASPKSPNSKRRRNQAACKDNNQHSPE